LFTSEHLHKSIKEEAKRITRRAEEAAKRKKNNNEPNSIGSGNSKKKISTNTATASTETTTPTTVGERITDSPEPFETTATRTEEGREGEGSGGIWVLHGEHPPPSSIAARKDTVSHIFTLESRDQKSVTIISTIND